MSKSLKRVAAALADAGVTHEVFEMTESTRTAADAAREIGCNIDQIAKSIIFRGTESGQAVVFVTAGGNRVDPVRAAIAAGEPLERADASFVRETTGFVIGGVSPIAHRSPARVFFDPKLFGFSLVYAAAGTPHHIFSIAPRDLHHLAGATNVEFAE